jgi:chromosome segregation ATPase
MEGFRRFAEQTTIDLSPSVIAIVGPNEAGKSSLLNALARVSRDDPFAEGDFSGTEHPDNDDKVILSAEYVVEATDKEELTDIPNTDTVRVYRVVKRANGTVERQLSPSVRRPLGSRERVRADLQRAAKHRKLGPELV